MKRRLGLLGLVDLCVNSSWMNGAAGFTGGAHLCCLGGVVWSMRSICSEPKATNRQQCFKGVYHHTAYGIH